MAVKSIIDIEVNDEAFQRFVALFKKYDEALKATPDAWKAADDAAKGTAVTFENMAAALLTQADYAAALSTQSEQHLARVAVLLEKQGQIQVEQAVRTEQHRARQALLFAKEAQERSEQALRAEQHLVKITNLLDKQKQPVAAQAFIWRDIARSSATFAEKITRATVALLKWSAITGVVSGIMGVGGLFGIDRLANNVSTGRKSSTGLGVTYGEQQAFETNYGRLVDAPAFLGGVNEALHDPQKRVGLYGAGLTQKDIEGKDTAQVANQLLPALKKVVDQTPDAMLAPVLRARHLDQFLSVQDAQRLKATPANELAEYQKQYAANARLLDLTKEQQKAWQDLQVQLHTAGLELENSLIKGLTGLAGPISELSGAFTNAVADFLKSKEVRDWITAFGHDIEWVAIELRSPEFRQGVSEIVHDVVLLAKAVAKALGWVAHKFSTDDQPEQPSSDYKPSQLPMWRRSAQPNESPTPTFLDRHVIVPGISPPLGEPAYVFPYQYKPWHAPDEAPISPAPSGLDTAVPGQLPMWRRSAQPNESPEPSFWDNRVVRPYWEDSQSSPFTREASQSPVSSIVFNQIERQNELPSGLINATYGAESSYGKDTATSYAGAEGPFQFMPETWQQYGQGKDVHNTLDAAKATGVYYRDLLDKFDNDPAKAAAAYNWGPKHVEDDVKQYGANWRQHLPQETQNYVSKILRGISQQRDKNVIIRVENNTGGNAIISAAVLAV